MNKHRKIIRSISKEMEIPETVVSAVVKHFFLGLRKIMYKNGDINIFGLFKITMKKPYRKKVDANPGINLRKRRLQKNKK